MGQNIEMLRRAIDEIFADTARAAIRAEAGTQGWTKPTFKGFNKSVVLSIEKSRFSFYGFTRIIFFLLSVVCKSYKLSVST